ncbi:MAG: hypothetical protein OXD54_01300 [Candidatus Poribacteria bacterium]|nr:hypothetical protein [Candidatus Poribacteria bacterium]
MQENNNLVPENNTQETSTPLTPLSLTDILDGMFTLYRNHFHLFFKISLVYFLIGFVIDIISMDFIVHSRPSDLPILSFFILFPSLLLSMFVVGGLSYASANVFLGRNITSGDALRQILRRYLPYLGGFIIYSLAILGMFITCIGIPFAVYFMVRWGLYGLPVLFEETPTMASLRRSTELVKGTWWRVCGIMFALLIIYYMILTIISTSISFVFFLIPGAAEIPQDATIIESMSFIFTPTPRDIGWTLYMIRSFITIGITALALPIGSIGSTLLYFDLRIRKEAYDIEMQATN